MEKIHPKKVYTGDDVAVYMIALVIKILILVKLLGVGLVPAVLISLLF